jgi:hypothetical protein
VKLITELEIRKSGTSLAYDKNSRTHDCYAAHALMQAMETLDPIKHDYSLMELVELIENKADELMRGWGFEK